VACLPVLRRPPGLSRAQLHYYPTSLAVAVGVVARSYSVAGVGSRVERIEG